MSYEIMFAKPSKLLHHHKKNPSDPIEAHLINQSTNKAIDLRATNQSQIIT